MWCGGGATCDGLLVMLNSSPPLHLHHTPLDAAVADITEVLHVLLHALGNGVSHHRREATFLLFEVLVVPYLERRSNAMKGKTVGWSGSI